MQLNLKLIIDLLEEIDDLLAVLQNFTCTNTDTNSKDICEFTEIARNKVSELIEILKASENSKIIKLAIKLFNYLNTKKGVS